MPTKEELEQKYLKLQFKAQQVKKELERKEKVEREKARKRDTHFKIIMGGGLYGALGRYLDKDEAKDVTDWLLKERQDKDGNDYTLADKLLEYIEIKNQERTNADIEKEGE